MLDKDEFKLMILDQMWMVLKEEPHVQESDKEDTKEYLEMFISANGGWDNFYRSFSDMMKMGFTPEMITDTIKQTLTKVSK